MAYAPPNPGQPAAVAVWSEPFQAPAVQAPAGYHYVVVRADLSIGFAAAQICHASGESVSGQVAEGTNAVILAVASEPELLALAAKLVTTGEPHVVIHEPDAPWCGAATAIGVAPRTGRLKLVSGLPLYGGPRRA